LDALDGAVDLSELVVILSGGAILSPTVKTDLAERLPGSMIIDGYGSSEAGGQGQSVTVAGAEPSEAPRFRVNDETTVLTSDFTPAPVGVIGKLARRGHIPLGYYKDPEKTAGTFRTVGDRRYSIPGDYATIDADGTIRLLGRGSACINTGGEKVYPEEVELALRSHDAVFDCVVVGVPDERWGEMVVALVQAQNGKELVADALRDHCRATLAAYKVPKRVMIVDSLERSPAGKADYKRLRELAAQEMSNQ
jgi:acyl-CoA synthetase (AMP-forming)/AMP-acid ligase II